jgi:hypothetical protein
MFAKRLVVEFMQQGVRNCAETPRPSTRRIEKAIEELNGRDKTLVILEGPGAAHMNIVWAEDNKRVVFATTTEGATYFAASAPNAGMDRPGTRLNMAGQVWVIPAALCVSPDAALVAAGAFAEQGTLTESVAWVFRSQDTGQTDDPSRDASTSVTQVLIDDWIAGTTQSRSLPAKTSDDIERAICLLDGQKHTLLILLSHDRDTFMSVGGGPDRYVVEVNRANKRFDQLRDDENTPDRQIRLMVGGQEGLFQARYCVVRSSALLAAQHFWSSGKLAASLTWDHRE